jgi:hypothetical protein
MAARGSMCSCTRVRSNSSMQARRRARVHAQACMQWGCDCPSLLFCSLGVRTKHGTDDCDADGGLAMMLSSAFTCPWSLMDDCLFGMYMMGCAGCVDGRRHAWDAYTHVSCNCHSSRCMSVACDIHGDGSHRHRRYVLRCAAHPHPCCWHALPTPWRRRVRQHVPHARLGQ